MAGAEILNKNEHSILLQLPHFKETSLGQVVKDLHQTTLKKEVDIQFLPNLYHIKHRNCLERKVKVSNSSIQQLTKINKYLIVSWEENQESMLLLCKKKNGKASPLHGIAVCVRSPISILTQL